jgi:hypothetical protein
MGIRHAIKLGEYKVKRYNANGTAVRVTVMGLGSCVNRTYNKVKTWLGEPTIAELKGQLRETVNEIEIQYYRRPSVHGKTVVLYTSNVTNTEGDKENFHLQIPDEMPLMAFISYCQEREGKPADLAAAGLLNGRKYPIAAAE